MSVPRMRFTGRQLGIMVAVVAVVLAVERLLFHVAADVLRSSHEGHSIRVKALVLVLWVTLNALAIEIAAAIVRAAMRDHAEARNELIDADPERSR